jgi:antirestriction protein
MKELPELKLRRAPRQLELQDIACLQLPAAPEGADEAAWIAYCDWMSDEAEEEHFEMTYRGHYASPEDFAKYMFLCFTNSEEWVMQYFNFASFLETLVNSGYLIITDEKSGDVHVFDMHR